MSDVYTDTLKISNSIPIPRKYYSVLDQTLDILNDTGNFGNIYEIKDSTASMINLFVESLDKCAE